MAARPGAQVRWPRSGRLFPAGLRGSGLTQFPAVRGLRECLLTGRLLPRGRVCQAPGRQRCFSHSGLGLHVPSQHLLFIFRSRVALCVYFLGWRRGVWPGCGGLRSRSLPVPSLSVRVGVGRPVGQCWPSHRFTELRGYPGQGGRPEQPVLQVKAQAGS